VYRDNGFGWSGFLAISVKKTQTNSHSRRFAGKDLLDSILIRLAWIGRFAGEKLCCMTTGLIYADEVYAITGACLEVYNVMGSGFLEAVYQKCLERELALRGIPYESQKGISLSYKGIPIGQDYTPDFICYGKIIVEIKAEAKLVDANRAQIINYLNATSFKVGLLVNFGHHKTLERERFVLTAEK